MPRDFREVARRSSIQPERQRAGRLPGRLLITRLLAIPPDPRFLPAQSRISVHTTRSSIFPFHPTTSIARRAKSPARHAKTAPEILHDNQPPATSHLSPPRQPRRSKSGKCPPLHRTPHRRRQTAFLS